MADLKISQLTGATTPLGGTEEVPLVQSGATKKVSVANLTAGRAIAASSVTVGNGRTQLASTYVADVPGPTGNNTGILFGGNTIFPCDGNGSLTNGVASLGTSSYQWYDIFLANNVNIRTAAKGVNFTANTPAAGMTSQLLNWYEEGTWTPTVEGTSTAGTATYSIRKGYYTRIGRNVTVFLAVAWSSGTGTGNLKITGLPFTSNADLGGSLVFGLADNLAVTASNYPTALTNGTSIFIYQTPTGGGAATDVPYDASAYIVLSGTYFV